MIADLGKLIPVEPRIADADTILKWTEHYKTILRKYGFDNRNEKMFNLVARYLAVRNSKREGFTNLSKGLFLFGGVGTGKTHAMRILSGQFQIEMVTAHELASQYAIGGDKGFIDYVADLQYKELIIDDVGAERELKHFGNAGIIGDYLTKRYELWVYEGKLTHITSNLSEEEFVQRYGIRNWSRLQEMSGLIPCIGEDRRTANN